MRILPSSKCAFATARHVHDFLFRSVERALRDTYAGAPGAAPPPTDADSLLPPVTQGSIPMWPARGHASSACACPNRRAPAYMRGRA